MTYFSPAEASLPVVEEVTPSGNKLRVVLRMGSTRVILDGVVDSSLRVGDTIDKMPRYSTRREQRTWSPFDGVDDD